MAAIPHNEDIEAQKIEVWTQDQFDTSETKENDTVMAEWKILELIKCPNY